jgi:hypothetical protein
MTIIGYLLQCTGSDSMRQMFKELIRGPIRIAAFDKRGLATFDALERRGLAEMTMERDSVGNVEWEAKMSLDAKKLLEEGQ